MCPKFSHSLPSHFHSYFLSTKLLSNGDRLCRFSQYARSLEPHRSKPFHLPCIYVTVHIRISSMALMTWSNLCSQFLFSFLTLAYRKTKTYFHKGLWMVVNATVHRGLLLNSLTYSSYGYLHKTWTITWQSNLLFECGWWGNHRLYI